MVGYEIGGGSTDASDTDSTTGACAPHSVLSVGTSQCWRCMRGAVPDRVRCSTGGLARACGSEWDATVRCGVVSPMRGNSVHCPPGAASSLVLETTRAKPRYLDADCPAQPRWGLSPPAGASIRTERTPFVSYLLHGSVFQRLLVGPTHQSGTLDQQMASNIV